MLMFKPLPAPWALKVGQEQAAQRPSLKVLCIPTAQLPGGDGLVNGQLPKPPRCQDCTAWPFGASKPLQFVAQMTALTHLSAQSRVSAAKHMINNRALPRPVSAAMATAAAAAALAVLTPGPRQAGSHSVNQAASCQCRHSTVLL